MSNETKTLYGILADLLPGATVTFEAGRYKPASIRVACSQFGSLTKSTFITRTNSDASITVTRIK